MGRETPLALSACWLLRQAGHRSWSLYLLLEFNEQGLIDLQTWITTQLLYAQPELLLALGKRGPDEPADHALDRSRGGLTTKIHMLCEANGTPLRFLLSGGQASDINYAQPLLDDVCIPSSQRGRPRKCCKWLFAERGYDAEELRRYCDQYRMQPVIPMRSMKRKPKPGLPRLFDRPKYRQRNVIERMFGWLKENRSTVTRFDKLAKSYAAMVSLACFMRCLQHLFSYRPRKATSAPSGTNDDIRKYDGEFLYQASRVGR